MKIQRHEALGIKQVIRFEWMVKTVNLLLAGLDKKQIRQELHEYLSESKGSGATAVRGATSRSQAVNMLMKIWVSPAKELVPLRDEALTLFRSHSEDNICIHWCMVSAAYPFWFNVALQIGRLLNLQDKVTQRQIFDRLKEQYGDRETVARYARYAVRSMVAWDLLKDSPKKGCYEKTNETCVADPAITVLMLESALQASPQGKGELGLLLNSPAFFPLQPSVISGDFVSQKNDRVDMLRYGLDDELLKLIF